jgi:hypothetical protein
MVISWRTVPSGVRPVTDRPPAIRPKKNGDEGCRLDEGVAGQEFLSRQKVGKDAVFDRAEQSRDDAEPKQRRIKQRQRGESEPQGCDSLDQYFREFETPRKPRLVLRIRHFAAKPGEEKRGSHESANRERDQWARLGFAEPEQDQHGEHVAHEIIVEDGKKLAPEQTREAACPQQGGEHGKGRKRSGGIFAHVRNGSAWPTILTMPVNAARIFRSSSSTCSCTSSTLR